MVGPVCLLERLFAGVFFGLSPLSRGLLGSLFRRLLAQNVHPGQAGRTFRRKCWPMIPSGARVASTDYVHPRFTHFARSYDYSDYPAR